MFNGMVVRIVSSKVLLLSLKVMGRCLEIIFIIGFWK